MIAHTPGPWRMLTTDAYDAGWVLDDGFCYRIAMVPNSSKEPANEANARLIAAAPELLEALTALLRETPAALERRYANSDTLAAFKAAEAAIAKATQP